MNEIYYLRDLEGNVIAEYDGAGNLLSEYVYANGQRIAKMDPDGTMDYYLNDHAGKPAQVLGSARAMAGSGWSANYYPFGEIASQTGSEEDTHFDFTGQERDRETGLMYFGARYYDPSIGRWLNVDPLAEKYPSFNPYNYCANNPLRFTDINGRILRDENGKIIFTPSKSVGMSHKSTPGTVVSEQEGNIYADDGRPITAYKNQSIDRRFDTDCHGTTFADGEYWINDNQVNDILQGDDYQNVSDPQVGDVVIYTDENGDIVHSATVTSINAETVEVTVEGLGGTQTETSQTNVNEAWSDPNATFSYYRKQEKND